MFVGNPSEFFIFALHEKLGGFFPGQISIFDEYTIFVGNSSEYIIFVENSSEIYSSEISYELRIGGSKHRKNRTIIAIHNKLMTFRGLKSS